MNERIRELMRESGVKTFFPGDPGSGAPGPEGVYFGLTETQKLEKFAELIVGECLKIAKNREDEFESAGLLEESNAVGNVAYRISRQFGVKR